MGGLHWLTLVLAILCLPRRTWRFAVTPCCVLLTVHQSLVRSVGYINHAEVSLLLATYVFAIRAWTPRPGRNFEPLTIALLVTLTYMLTGTYRIAHGGLSVFTSDSIVYWAVENALCPEYFEFGWGAHVVRTPLSMELLKAGNVWVTLSSLPRRGRSCRRRSGECSCPRCIYSISSCCFR